ncbi:hypothetical protein ACSS6W_009329 [Trichoderma asperelloides]
MSSSRRDMASSTVVVVALFTQRSIDAIDGSNKALGVYLIGGDSSRMHSMPTKPTRGLSVS